MFKDEFKFQRTQWAVGHGGFHTGLIRYGDADSIHYFFDCGASLKEDKQKIDGHINNKKFAFGVISHFHSDHMSQLESVDVDLVFIPYLTSIDILFNIVARNEGVKETQAALKKTFEVFNGWRTKGKLVMVRHQAAERGRESPRRNLTGVLGIEGLSGSASVHPDGVPLYISAAERLVALRFFNYRHDDISASFRESLEQEVTAGHAVDANGKKLSALADFEKAVEESPAKMYSLNKVIIKNICLKSLKENGLGGKYFNISSLALSSNTVSRRRYMPGGRLNRRVVSAEYKDKYFSSRHNGSWSNGWITTGDLELTEKVWPGFQNHYDLDLEYCVAFNVPHHGSEIALCDSAMHLLSDVQFLLLPVPSDSEEHPNPVLKERLDKHCIENQILVNSEPESSFTFTVSWIPSDD